MKEKIDYLKTLKKHQLDKWKDAETIEIPVGEKTGILTVFKDTTSDGKDLLIVQAFVPTWKSPNYLSIGLIGRIFAEGFFIDGENNISEASDDDLWPYR